MRVITTGGKEFSRKLSKIEEKMLTRALMGQIAGAAVTSIFKRTVQEGKDKNDKAFQPYSRGYIEKKKERGGKFFSTSPNLFDGGDMLGDLQFAVESKKRAFLHFPKTSENLKASGHINGSRHLPRRDFFGTTPKEEKALMLIPQSHLQELLNG